MRDEDKNIQREAMAQEEPETEGHGRRQGLPHEFGAKPEEAAPAEGGEVEGHARKAAEERQGFW